MTSAADQRRRGADEFSRAGQAAQFILSKLKDRPGLRVPKIAVVLGSGLGDFAAALQDSLAVAYEKIPSFPRSTAIGHAGRLVIGNLGAHDSAVRRRTQSSEVTVAVMQGRAHLYEGYSATEVTFPMRVLGRLGVRALVITNAAGGINSKYRRGALVLLSDHINLQGANPLSGPNDARFGPRFPDMTEAYARRCREIALQEGRKLGIPLREGVYAALAGPSYETPAEIRHLRAIGADLVGMSTVPEVIVARHMGIEVLAIACVTNMAAGLSRRHINHEEVLATGARVQGKLLKLLAAVIPRLEESLRAAPPVPNPESS